MSRTRLVLVVDEHRFPLRLKDCFQLLDDMRLLGIFPSPGPLSDFPRIRILNLGPKQPGKGNPGGR